MRPLPYKLRVLIDTDPYFKKCARRSSECQGRITVEHALIFARRQLHEPFAIIPLCEWHHGVGPFMAPAKNGLNKEINRLIALKRATPEELDKYPKAMFRQQLRYLTQKYDKEAVTTSD